MSKTLHEQLVDSDKSAMQRYQELALGTDSFYYLLKYELIMLFASKLPGALGLVVRKKLYPMLLGSVGRNVIFGQGVTLRHGLKVHIGDNVVIDDYVTLDAKGIDNDGMKIGDNVIVSRGVVFSCKNANLYIGSDCTFGINTLVQAVDGSDVVIGNDVLVAAYVYIIGCGPYGTDKLDVPFKKQGIISKGGIHISDNVWLGSGSQIMDGVKIGTGSIVGSNSVVNKSIGTNIVSAGIPSKTLKVRQ